MNINLDTDYRKNYLEERYPGLSQKDAAIALSCEDEGTVTRFLNKLKYEGNCIMFTGQLNRGYGYFYVNVGTGLRQVAVKAHRFSYAVHYGFDNLPTGKMRSGFEDYVLNHICHNRACVNPLHLEVITQRENMSLDKLKPR